MDVSIREDNFFIIAFSLIRGVGPVILRRILINLESISEAFRTSKSLLKKIPGIGNDIAEKIATQREDALKKAEKIIELCRKQDINIITILDDGYPLLLKSCDDAPCVLYLKGGDLVLDDKVIGVVGTRRPSSYGLKICEEIVRGFKGLNIWIASGFAEGIDAKAHNTAIENNIKTLAVFACNPSYVYPSSNKALYKKMLDTGNVIISEFPPNTIPLKEYFPRRNRIIAGISKAIVVIESKVDGGAMITANYAKEYNRMVFAVPARSSDESFSGCLSLLVNGHAKCAYSSEHILQTLKWMPPKKITSLFQDVNATINSLTAIEKEILLLIKQHGEIHLENLLVASKVKPSDVITVILQLELKGLVKEIPGKRYVSLI